MNDTNLVPAHFNALLVKLLAAKLISKHRALQWLDAIILVCLEKRG